MNITDYTLATHKTPWRLFEPSGGNREWCVLFLQGFRSTIAGSTLRVKNLANATSTCFAMLDYAGRGDHPTPLAKAVRSQQLSEVTGVYDKLIELGFKRIIVIGSSFGGYMAALLAGKRACYTLVLRAPANYPEQEFDMPFADTSLGRKQAALSVFRNFISEDFTNNAIQGVQGFGGQTYVLEHQNDEVIPAIIPKSYYKAAQHGNYICILGLGHSPKKMSNPDKYFALIDTWLTTIVITTKQAREFENL